MSVMFGVYRQSGLPDEYIPIAVDSLGVTTVSGSTGGSSATLPTTISCGRATIGTTASALPAITLSNGIVVTSDIDNTGLIYIGASGVTTSANGYKLSPGQSISFGVGGAAAVNAIASAAGQVLYYAGN